jgi:methylglutaconyl-CoA hydratase
MKGFHERSDTRRNARTRNRVGYAQPARTPQRAQYSVARPTLSVNRASGKRPNESCRHFTRRGSGLDLQEAADRSLVDSSAAAVARSLNLLRSTSLIAIAAVQGGAFAGGAGLMAAADIVIAGSDSHISFPEGRRGLLPALICGVLARKVREGDLRELFLAGDPIDALRAKEVGLVQRVVPKDRLLDEALRVGRSIIAGGPHTIRTTKALINAMFRHADESYGTDLIQQHLGARHSDEAREGLRAFAEKRQPNWSQPERNH